MILELNIFCTTAQEASGTTVNDLRTFFPPEITQWKTPLPKPAEDTSESGPINIMIYLIGKTLNNNYNSHGFNVSFTA